MKKKIIGLWGILVFLVLVSMIGDEYTDRYNSSNQKIKDNLSKEDNEILLPKAPKQAGFAHFRDWIHIDGSDPNNWSDTATTYEWCYFENYYYVIENVTINATNSPNYCGILIENSLNDYFIIRNCTIFNAEGELFAGGITLRNTNNGTVSNNNLTDNNWAINLFNANNNNVTDNIISNSKMGIVIFGGRFPMWESYNNTVKGNNLTQCGIGIFGSLNELLSNTIDTSNKVSQKPVYYYVNETYLSPENFTNAGHVMLYYSNHSKMTNLNTSYSSTGIIIDNCINITVANCNSSYNNYDGIYIYSSKNVTISNNRMVRNEKIGISISTTEYSNVSLNYYECADIGIELRDSPDAIIKNNTMVRCGIFLSDDTPPLPEYTIDTSNTVNGKPVYYYKNKNNLGTDNFTNPGQIILDNCNNSLISNFKLSKGSCGILLFSSQNVSIINNNVSFSKKIGIRILESNNITVTYNDADHCETGIQFYTGRNNNISYNSASYNDDAGIYLSTVDDTIFNDNNITHNRNLGNYPSGLYMETCSNVNITNSFFFNNTLDAIYLSTCSLLTIENNIIINNTDGIVLTGTDFCEIKSNIISNNTRYGIFIYDTDADNNVIYNNTFDNNLGKNAYDIYANNQWDDGSLGNWWHDYAGTDANDNGIGDTGYNINAAPLVEDRYPKFWDGPQITVVMPTPYQLCGNNSPLFLVFVFEGIEDTVWYTLGNDPTMYNITGIVGAKINQTGWNKLANGTVIIHFYVNDSRGLIDNENVIIFKDSIAPYITINKPKEGLIFNATAPRYNLTFFDAHLNDTWYRVWNQSQWSINYTIPSLGAERTGQIDQGAWDNCPNGTIIIEFYANDTLGNLRINSTTVLKDSLGPLININDPTPNELFSSKAPDFADCNVVITDGNGVDESWYMLINATDSTDYTNNNTWSDRVDQFMWDFMDNGSVILKIFANDSLGNIGKAQVTIRKDIEQLSILIIKPALNDIFSNSTFNFTISVSGKDLDTIWYMLINGTDNSDHTNNFTYSQTVSEGTIEDILKKNLWNQFENGSVIFKFYLNRTNGLTVSDAVLVRKDIIAPNITIILPVENQTVTRTPPNFIISIKERNIHTKWYRLFNGTDYSGNFTFTTNTTFNKGAWELMWDSIKIGENLTIIFYCNDTAGNLGFANVTVIKQISHAVLPSGSGDDDDGGKKTKKEEFEIVESIMSPVGLAVTGGSAVGVVTISIIIKKRISVKKRIKEIERIERLRKD